MRFTEAIQKEQPHAVANRAIDVLEKAIHDEFGLNVRMGAELEYVLWDKDKKPIDLPMVRKSHKEQVGNPPLFEPKDGNSQIVVKRPARFIRTHYSEDKNHGQYEVVFDHLPENNHGLKSLARAIESTKRLIDYNSRQFGNSGNSFSPVKSSVTNGLHINLSLYDDHGKNILNGKVGKTLVDGLSLFKGDICAAAMLPTIKDALFIFLPQEKSLGRIHKRTSYAPKMLNTSAMRHSSNFEDCALAVRNNDQVLDETRIENRIPGSDADPYAVIVANLVAVYNALKTMQSSVDTNEAKTMYRTGTANLGKISANYDQLKREFNANALLSNTLNALAPHEKLGDQFISSIQQKSTKAKSAKQLQPASSALR